MFPDSIVIIAPLNVTLGLTALKRSPLPKFISSAVVTRKEPFTLTTEFSPKIIPLGLIKNKLAAPSTPNVPKISEMFSPVTREKIFAIPSGLAKLTLAPSPTLNS